MRIGQGFDVHVFAENRPLIIGGINIPYNKGLLGHSDADVLLHAITDALLGAIGAGDIGEWFPDTDPQYKDADSKELLMFCNRLVQKKGYKINNIDCTVIAEKPKLAAYKDVIKNEIAQILKLDVDRINVKATTTEKIGAIGREEGIGALAIVLLDEITVK